MLANECNGTSLHVLGDFLLDNEDDRPVVSTRHLSIPFSLFEGLECSGPGPWLRVPVGTVLYNAGETRTT